MNMKKVYIQPQTDLMDLQGFGLCQELVVGSNGNPIEGKMGAPGRTYSPAPSLENL